MNIRRGPPRDFDELEELELDRLLLLEELDSEFDEDDELRELELLELDDDKLLEELLEELDRLEELLELEKELDELELD
jgi:hypothetical protein